MIETLNSWDTELLLFLNSLHNNYLDHFMWVVTKTQTWIPMCCVLLFFIFRKDWKQGTLILLMIALTITFADQISSGIIKPLVERYRPTHEAAIANVVHIVRDYRGGQYGFVSSHAANTLGVAFLLALVFRKWHLTLALMGWALLVSYSRIYLGVHYPGDILGGAVVGLLSGGICYYLYLLIGGRLNIFGMALKDKFPDNYTLIITSAILFNIFVVVWCAKSML